LGYITVAETLGISSITFTQCIPEATEFGETQNKGNYGVQGRSRSFKVTAFRTNRNLIYDNPISD